MEVCIGGVYRERFKFKEEQLPPRWVLDIAAEKSKRINYYIKTQTKYDYREHIILVPSTYLLTRLNLCR